MSMIRKCHNHTVQTNPQHCDEERSTEAMFCSVLLLSGFDVYGDCGIEWYRGCTTVVIRSVLTLSGVDGTYIGNVDVYDDWY